MGYTISNKEAIKRTAEIVGFETPIGPFAQILKREYIDQDKFGEGLQRKYPGFNYKDREYEGMSISTEEFVILKFGKDNTEIIKQALMIDDPDHESIIKKAASNLTERLLKKISFGGGSHQVVEKWLDLTWELEGILGVSLPLDATMTEMRNTPSISLPVLDSMLSDKDPEYSWIECKYLGINATMEEYVQIKFGKRASDLVMFFSGQKTLEELEK